MRAEAGAHASAPYRRRATAPMRLARTALVLAASTLLGVLGSPLRAMAAGADDATAPARRVSFDPTDLPLPNPERGFYGRVELERPGAYDLEAQVRAGLTLLHAYVRLDAYVDRALPDAFLAALDAGFAEVRRAGAKVVLRFTYNFPSDLRDPAQIRDAKIERTLAHIGQLAPVLARNVELIAFLEAGFVGAWGEWHSSGSGLDTPQNKLRIRNALLAALPPQRMVLFRRPLDLLEWHGPAIWSGAPAPGTALARSGLHNDCFLSSPTDAGTYPADRPELRAAARRAAAHVPFGGETCDAPPARGRCADILEEGRAYGVTYLNDAFYRPSFHDRWAAEGCLRQVERLLGHRMRLVSMTLPAAVRRGGRLAIELQLGNDGWARPYNPRDVVLRLESRTAGQAIELKARGADVRRWLPTPPGTPPIVERLEFELPATLAAGEHDVAIGLPDPGTGLAADPRYAIRPANADRPAAGQRWDASSGRFRTGVTLSVR
jgi:hypothetical protein